MTDAPITRAFAGDIEVRSDGTGRTITGIVVPFDKAARVSDGGPSYEEQFKRGAFAKTIRERGDRVKLLYQHDSREPIGRARLLREDSAGLYGEFSVSNVPSGDHALELVRDGVLDSFSVGFAPVKHEKRDGVTVRLEVALREASLVTFPAYQDARIGALRAALEDMSPEERAALLGHYALARDLTPDPTGDGQPGPDAPPVIEPASATRDVLHSYLSLRRRAREIGAI